MVQKHYKRVGESFSPKCIAPHRAYTMNVSRVQSTFAGTFWRRIMFLYLDCRRHDIVAKACMWGRSQMNEISCNSIDEYDWRRVSEWKTANVVTETEKVGVEKNFKDCRASVHVIRGAFAIEKAFMMVPKNIRLLGCKYDCVWFKRWKLDVVETNAKHALSLNFHLSRERKSL